ncbi:TonB-dependent receptor [Croceicoccus naphthovorans]|uniref:TonB-dependent receptor n=1 Tax=Croceicoccus naphthovorans TaxID=1348774 RepID=A0A0G3XI58_9SPHN|nr:TonB-dependent receptor [Croceicoccus naphthovorans]AKM10892.1 TonB-dependent receptor [Croceicoccus naphthovorans]MBB3989129.1 outer membrane receptor protein involved in Fe transport [Croceicoccus naphthovorans]
MHFDRLPLRTVLTAGAGALALTLPGIAHAQDDEQDPNQIIVTATKRSVVITEIPQSISVVGEETLERQQAKSFADYAELVPSLTITQSNPGETRIILRGINTGSVGSTVAIYVDDTPFGSSSSLGNAAVLAGDFDTFDLERVEVLRGPQGTLYGSNALGGVIRFVTTAPKLGTFEGKAQAGIETVDGGGTGWLANAVLNVPVGENAAIRASGFYRKQAGYIDAIGRPFEKNINDADIYGGRISALFEPTEDFSVRLTAIAQNIRAGSPGSYDVDSPSQNPITVDPTTGDDLDGLSRVEFYPESNDVDYRLYNGKLDYDLGFATLSSITSYGELSQTQLTDNTVALGRLVTAIYQSPVDLGFFVQAPLDQTKFTQELRVSSPDSETFEWQFGAYYTDEKVDLTQYIRTFEVDTAELLSTDLSFFGNFGTLTLDSTYEEIAGFADATFHITPSWEVSGGIRYSHNSQKVEQTQIGDLVGFPELDVINGKSSESVFTWSASTRYEISDLTSIYARVAKGYRPGGPNVVPSGAEDEAPLQYGADTLLSYEIGLRAETADRRFAIDGAVYYLDWSDVLVLGAFETEIGTVGANDNGDGARVYGAEATATIRPTAGLTFMLNAAYNDAELTDDTPPVTGGLDGDPLPFTPKYAVTASADYEWYIGAATAFIGGDIRMISDQAANFSPAYRATYGQILEADGYAKVDLRAGVEFDAFSITAFARNVTNSRGLTNIGSFGERVGTQLSASPIQPRTLGVTAAVSF